MGMIVVNTKIKLIYFQIINRIIRRVLINIVKITVHLMEYVLILNVVVIKDILEKIVVILLFLKKIVK